MTGDTEHVETSKEKRLMGLFKSHVERELRPYPANASCREGLRSVALTPCCPVVRRRNWLTGTEPRIAKSMGLIFGFSSRPPSGISCAAEE